MLDYMTIKKLISPDINLVVFDSVESTNDYAKTLSRTNPSTDTVVIAREQTKGRGTKGRSFFSPTDTGIYMSYMFKSLIPINEIKPITPAAAVAVLRVLSNYLSVEGSIKWVNDVEVNGKKLAGILTETVSNPKDFTAYVVVGIGMNTSTIAFPEDIKDRAISLSEITKDFDVNILYSRLINELERVRDYNMMVDDHDYIKEYKSSCSTLGKNIVFTQNEKDISGRVIDINNQGHLVVETEFGIISLASADIKQEY